MRLAIAALVTLAACGDDDASTSDGAGGSDASLCPGSPGGGCEEVVGSEAECPPTEEICDGVCGAAYDCCYCGQDPGTGEWAWQTLFIDCAPCGDAGP